MVLYLKVICRKKSPQNGKSYIEGSRVMEMLDDCDVSLIHDASLNLNDWTVTGSVQAVQGYSHSGWGSTSLSDISEELWVKTNHSQLKFVISY